MNIVPLNYFVMSKRQRFFLSQDMVQGLWTLSRGSVDDKLRWAFTLYDLDGDGQICRDEMTRVVTAIYELMGKFAEPWLKDGTTVAAHVDFVFQVCSQINILFKTFKNEYTVWFKSCSLIRNIIIYSIKINYFW